ncbi:hypothetical protein ACE4RR_12370 [Alteribacillus sp. HJP-4]
MSFEEAQPFRFPYRNTFWLYDSKELKKGSITKQLNSGLRMYNNYFALHVWCVSEVSEETGLPRSDQPSIAKETNDVKQKRYGDGWVPSGGNAPLQ